MADLVIAQTNPNFDFRHLDKMGPYPVLILSRPTSDASIEIGSLYNNITGNTTDRIEIEFDSGRTGSPAVDITITRSGVQGGPSTSVTLAYEPGVHAGNDGEGNAWYNLHTFGLQWQGRSGGGGMMYANDPVVIRGLSIAVKRTLLKVGMITHAYVARDPSAFAALRRLLQPVDLLQTLLDHMTSPLWTAWLYVIIPQQDEVRIQRPVLEPIFAMCSGNLRPPRYHPYTQPRIVLDLDMPHLPGFRNSMYCDLITNQQNQQVLGPPTRQIMDTVGCKEAASHAIGHSVGLIRENQGHEEFCEDLGKVTQSIRLVRSQYPVHTKATRSFGAGEPAAMRPTDLYAYLGFVKIVRTSRQFSITAPKRGSMFLVRLITRDGAQHWIPTQQFCYGTVLGQHAAVTAAGADFAMVLQMPASMRDQASRDVSSAQPGGISLSYIRNRGPAQIELDALRGFGNNLRGTARDWRTKVCAQQLKAPHLADIRGGPQHNMVAMYTAAVAWAKQQQLINTNDRSQVDLLDVVPASIDRQSTLIRTSVRSARFPAIRLAMLMLIAVHHRIVFVIDEPEDRAQLAYDLYRDLQRINAMPMSTQLHGRMSHLHVLRYSSTDVDFDPNAAGSNIQSPLSDRRNRTRPILDIQNKFICDDLPDESYLFDNGTYHNSPDSVPPPATTPLPFSLGDSIRNHLSAHPRFRAQYYTDRARLLDNATPLPFPDAIAILQWRHDLVRDILSRTGILICDYETAASEDVVKSMNGSVLVLGNTQRVNFSGSDKVVLRHNRCPAVYVLGDEGDRRFARVEYAGGDRSEARVSFERGFWEVLRIGGSGALDLR